MIVMCWASQSSAQPTRAKIQPIQSTHLLQASNYHEDLLAVNNNKITPRIVREVNKVLVDHCTFAEEQIDNKLNGHNPLTGIFYPAIAVGLELFYGHKIALSGVSQTKVIQQPKHGSLVSTGYEKLDNETPNLTFETF